jgi:hypothetical protein
VQHGPVTCFDRAQLQVHDPESARFS